MSETDLKKKLLLAFDQSPLFGMLPEGMRNMLKNFYRFASDEQIQKALQTLGESDVTAEPVRAELVAIGKQEAQLQAEANQLMGKANGIMASLNQDRDRIVGDQESEDILAVLEA